MFYKKQNFFTTSTSKMLKDFVPCKCESKYFLSFILFSIAYKKKYSFEFQEFFLIHRILSLRVTEKNGKHKKRKKNHV